MAIGTQHTQGPVLRDALFLHSPLPVWQEGEGRTGRGTMACCVGEGTGRPAGGRKERRAPRPCPEQALPAGGCGMALKTPTKLFSSTPRPPHEHRIRSLTSKRKIFNSRKEKILKF